MYSIDLGGMVLYNQKIFQFRNSLVHCCIHYIPLVQKQVLGEIYWYIFFNKIVISIFNDKGTKKFPKYLEMIML